MKRKTTSRLILFFAVVAFFGYLLGHGDFGFDIDGQYAARNVFMIAFGVMVFLCMLKIVSSRLFFNGLNGVRLSTLEGVFMFYYLFLDKEAREEWGAYIEKRKSEGG